MTKPSSRPNKLAPVSFRLDPKVKFAAEILARHQRRSLASTVEWALMLAMEKKSVQLSPEPGAAITLNELVNMYWSEDELIRSVNIAFIAPNLANHDESCIKTVILSSTPLLFKRVEPTAHELSRVNIDAVCVVRELLYQRSRELSETGVLAPITNDEWAEIYKKKTGLKANIEELISQYKNEDPDVLFLKLADREQQIVELNHMITVLASDYNFLVDDVRRLSLEKD